MIKISTQIAIELIERLSLAPGDSFTNTMPSELSQTYEINTGYWLEYGNSRLVYLKSYKEDWEDSREDIIHKAWLCISYETFGIDPDEPKEEQLELYDKMEKILKIIKEMTGLDSLTNEL